MAAAGATITGKVCLTEDVSQLPNVSRTPVRVGGRWEAPPQGMFGRVVKALAQDPGLSLSFPPPGREAWASHFPS